MAKQLLFSDDARQALLRGINVVAKAVVTTLGPKGRNIALERKWGGPNVVHDGVTVATVSAQNQEIGNMIAQALEKVGRDGVITVEEGKGLTIDIEYKEGMEFDRGYASAYLVTNPEKMEAEVEDAYILLTDKKISAIADLLPFLEKFVKVSKNLVIVADEVEGEALAI